MHGMAGKMHENKDRQIGPDEEKIMTYSTVLEYFLSHIAPELYDGAVCAYEDFLFLSHNGRYIKNAICSMHRIQDPIDSWETGYDKCVQQLQLMAFA